MYSIQKSAFGYTIVFSGNITVDEVRHWQQESVGALSKTHGAFGVIIDGRDMSPPSMDVRNLLVEGRNLYIDKGMVRSALVLSNVHLVREYGRRAQAFGIAGIEKYIDASRQPNWWNLAINWVTQGVDPESSTKATEAG